MSEDLYQPQEIKEKETTLLHNSEYQAPKQNPQNKVVTWHAIVADSILKCRHHSESYSFTWWLRAWHGQDTPHFQRSLQLLRYGHPLSGKLRILWSFSRPEIHTKTPNDHLNHILRKTKISNCSLSHSPQCSPSSLEETQRRALSEKQLQKVLFEYWKEQGMKGNSIQENTVQNCYTKGINNIKLLQPLKLRNLNSSTQYK